MPPPRSRCCRHRRQAEQAPRRSGEFPNGVQTKTRSKPHRPMALCRNCPAVVPAYALLADDGSIGYGGVMRKLETILSKIGRYHSKSAARAVAVMTKLRASAGTTTVH
jgi:hypothetical protein